MCKTLIKGIDNKKKSHAELMDLTIIGTQQLEIKFFNGVLKARTYILWKEALKILLLFLIINKLNI